MHDTSPEAIAIVRDAMLRTVRAECRVRASQF
jgi:hypothetical protein